MVPWRGLGRARAFLSLGRLEFVVPPSGCGRCEHRLLYLLYNTYNPCVWPSFAMIQYGDWIHG